jgi:hypothetical protein
MHVAHRHRVGTAQAIDGGAAAGGALTLQITAPAQQSCSVVPSSSAARRFTARAQRVVIGLRHIHFRGQRRPPRRIAGFHELLACMPTIRVQDG